MDVSFLIDVILTFFQAFTDEKSHRLVDKHRDIAVNYVKGWFLLDVLSIFPFEAFLSSDSGIANANKSLRIARVSKVYKMIRFVRLARLAKGINKMKKGNVQANMRISAGLKRLGMFASALVLGCHVLSCFWLAMSQFDDNNWIVLKLAELQGNGEEITFDDDLRVYFLSLYFTVETITTVGYGDVSPTNTKERIFLLLLMILGVISFSFIASGLTGIMSAYDDKKTEEKTRDNKLMQLRDRHEFDDKLYS